MDVMEKRCSMPVSAKLLAGGVAIGVAVRRLCRRYVDPVWESRG